MKPSLNEDIQMPNGARETEISWINFILGLSPNKFSSPKWSVLNIEAYKQEMESVDFMCVCECKRIIMKEERS